jgi:hypothetical protein
MSRRTARSVVALCLAALAALSLGACARSRDTVPVAYVASAGNNCVRVIDLASGETLRRIYTGAAPWRLVPSPDGGRLWVQHWFAGTTAVVDLDDHEVAAVLPFRGPGTFEADGSAFLTFDWPGSDLHRIEQVGSRDPRVTSTYSTRIKQAYDVTPGPGGDELYIAQYDPIAKGPVPRYGAVAALDPHDVDESPQDDDPAAMAATGGAGPQHPVLFEPRSISTGRSPRKVVAVPGQPFVLTADSETNGITLINENADRRVLAVCPAPLDLLLTPDLDHLVVLCWDESGSHASRIVSFAADFSHRPWPQLEKEAETEVTGALVAGAFEPSGDHLLAVDRVGGRMVELSMPGLEVTRTIATGDVPLDVAVVEVPTAARDRLRSGESDSRQRVRRALAEMIEANSGGAGPAPFDTLAWTELVSWLETPGEDPTGESAGEDGADAAEDEAPAEPAEPVEHSREVLVVLHSPDTVRTEIPEGGVRLASGGHSLSLDPAGRFWVTPRQDVASVVYSLPDLSVDEAVRRLAGDVPGSPFLRGGLAVDVIDEVQEAGEDFLVIGALPGAPAPGEDLEPAPVSQLWIDTATGRATDLIEQFPVFEAGGHGSAAPRAAETRFFDYSQVVGPDGQTGPVMPHRLERVVAGSWLQHVQLRDFRVDPDLPASLFDMKRLGDRHPAPGAIFREEEVDRRPADGGAPGWAVATELSPDPIKTPLAPFRPYLTSPPTSGPYLPFTAEWGVHDAPVPLPLQVHNLLDGGVALQYSCPEGCPDLVDALTEIARSFDSVLVAPYPWMETRLAVTAWGRMETFDDTDLTRGDWRQEVERFIGEYAGINHHVQAPGAPAVGAH